MFSNPFTEKRKKKEDEVKAKIEAHNEQVLMQQMQQQVQASPAPDMLAQFAEPDDGKAADAYAAEDFSKYLPASAQVDQAEPVWSGGGATYEAPSRARQCMGKLQSGFMIGASLGGAFGFMYGAYAAIKFKHVLYLPIAVIQAGGAFGFFLACGTVIRCDEKQFDDLLHGTDLLGPATGASARSRAATSAAASASAAASTAVYLKASMPTPIRKASMPTPIGKARAKSSGNPWQVDGMEHWDPWEDALLDSCYASTPRKWTKIAAAMGKAGAERTPSSIRARLSRREQGPVSVAQGGCIQRCRRCGKLRRGHVCADHTAHTPSRPHRE